MGLFDFLRGKTPEQKRDEKLNKIRLLTSIKE